MNHIESIKFNLSPLELLKPGYSQELIKIIDEYELPYNWFQFEITETVATEYRRELYETIKDFQSVGIEIRSFDVTWNLRRRTSCIIIQNH